MLPEVAVNFLLKSISAKFSSGMACSWGQLTFSTSDESRDDGGIGLYLLWDGVKDLCVKDSKDSHS